jgi:hypothetical protein
MKKFNLFAIIVLTVSLFACRKEEKISTPSSQAIPMMQANSYNENNTNSISWDQLPEELRNAEVYDASKKISSNKTDASYISQMGTWGGGGGDLFSIYPKSGTDKIYAIGIRSGSYVDGLSVWYKRTNGSIYSYVVGGTGGSFYLQPFLEGERITGIAGRSATYLDRLTIYTNQKTFSYGGNGGNTFYAGVSNSSSYQILGFYGGAANLVDRIGAYVYTN